MRCYGDEYVRIEDAIAFAWSAPMRELAKEVGSTDVSLKKTLVACGIPCPPQGYWNKVHAGHKVASPPKPPARAPGETGTILSLGKSPKLPPAPLASPEGPFASAKVPESLDDLYARELRAIGQPVSALRMGRTHPAIKALLDHDELLREKIAAKGMWHVGLRPLFESPYQRRRLRILNAIFLTLARRGYDSGAQRRDYSELFVTKIGDTVVDLALRKRGTTADPYYDNRTRPDPKQSAEADLELTASSWRAAEPRSWSDDKRGKLEDKIAEISAGLITAGEGNYRAGLAYAAKERADRHTAQLAQLQKAREEDDRHRLEALHRSGELLAKAEDLRALIRRVDEAVQNGHLDYSDSDLAEWRQWAGRQADALDPVLSGQIAAHLRRRADQS
jgi:hypothetical protein